MISPRICKSVHDPWTVATEVSPAVDGADAAAADGAEVRPPAVTCERISIMERSFEVEAARHEDQNLGIVFGHVVQALGLTIPQTLLLRADQVIE
jgi:hypothetical protein